MNSENSAPDIARARRVQQAIRDLPLADLPTVDLKDRLSVLTVASGLRNVGVLETWGQRLSSIRDRLIACGLATSVATCVWSTIERPEEVPHRKVLTALDRKRVAGKPRHVLWIYPSAKERSVYRQAEFTQQQAGELLQYPSCCIAFESSVMNLLPQAQLDALIREKGSADTELIRQVQRAGQLPAPKVPLPDNALRTEQRLPFCLHVACDACLSTSNSPSAKIDAHYGEFLRQVDADFHALFLAVQETYCLIGHDQSNNRNLLLEARELHRNFFTRIPKQQITRD